MPLAERFGSNLGTILGVQMRSISGITTFSVDEVIIQLSNTGPERVGTVNFTVDGETFEVELEFSDDAFEGRNIVGRQRSRERVV